MEGEAERVALCEEVRARVQVGGYVVGGLGGEEGKEGEVGVCGGGGRVPAGWAVGLLLEMGGWGRWAGDGVCGRLRGREVVEGCFWGVGVHGGGGCDGCEAGA